MGKSVPNIHANEHERQWLVAFYRVPSGPFYCARRSTSEATRVKRIESSRIGCGFVFALCSGGYRVSAGAPDRWPCA
jgi:hypothetical protein